MNLSNDDRRYGLCLAASRGAGKSRFLGRYLAFADFLAGVPTIIFDNGDTCDNVLDRITRLPEDLQKELWPRVRYIDLAGLAGRVVPFPLYYRLGKESNLTIAARFVRTILKIDPELSSASVQGKTAIVKNGYTSGVALVEKGWQISEIDQLNLKLEPTYEVRLLPMLLDDTQRAIHCADKPGIDWNEVIRKKQLVIFNYQFVEDPEFILTWILSYFLAFLQNRGVYGKPISLIIDELGAFQAAQARNSIEFHKDMRVLINTVMRRYNLWLTVGLQDLGDFSEEIQNLLLTLKTQLIGQTDSMPVARKLAAHFYRVNPKKEKRRRTQFLRQYDRLNDKLIEIPVDETVEDYTVQEQIQEAAYVFTDKLPQYTFLVKQRNGSVAKVSYADFERGIYVREDIVSKVRQWLMERDGRKIEAVLGEIAARTSLPDTTPAPLQVQKTKAKTLPVRTKGKLH